MLGVFLYIVTLFYCLNLITLKFVAKKKTISANKYELNIVILNSYVDVIVIYLFSKWMFLSKTN